MCLGWSGDCAGDQIDHDQADPVSIEHQGHAHHRKLVAPLLVANRGDKP
jgi:hypothetical protein